MAIDKALLQMMSCPSCKGGLEEQGERLVCNCCKLRYPVRSGIPIMMIDQAEKIT